MSSSVGQIALHTLPARIWCMSLVHVLGTEFKRTCNTTHTLALTDDGHVQSDAYFNLKNENLQILMNPELLHPNYDTAGLKHHMTTKSHAA